MNELLARIIDAHGGIERWTGYEKIDATIVSGGGLSAQGRWQDPNPRSVPDRVPTETVADDVDSPVCCPTRHRSFGAGPALFILKPKRKFQLPPLPCSARKSPFDVNRPNPTPFSSMAAAV
jgi:hypothetical protein